MHHNILTHILIHAIVLIVLASATIYPFIPGEYDRLAMPLSTLIQGFGIIGLLHSVLGLFWLLIPRKYRFFAKLSLFLAFLLTMVFTFIACLIAGLLFGIIILVLLVLIFFISKKRLYESIYTESFSFVPVYLLSLPLSVLIIQLFIAEPITNWSRNRTIAGADALIRDIESFSTKNGYYPKTLQAMYDDYSSQTVGVEKFHYLPFGGSYNISFEQPRFLLDIIGTKEWVVFNPEDEHRVYSHTSWFLLLPPEESESRQGWYSSVSTNHKHWKSFFFD